MRWFRQTLRKNRGFLLGFLLVETFFFLVDGGHCVYAYQVEQQKKEIALRSFALFDLFAGERAPDGLLHVRPDQGHLGDSYETHL